MFKFYLAGYRAPNTAADPLDGWEAGASELGLSSEPAEAAGGGEPAASSASSDATPAEESHDESAAAEAAPADAGDEPDEDADQDPLDLLTERDEADDPTQPKSIDDRYKALRKHARRLEREVKKSLPLRNAMREAGVDLRTLLTSHAQLQSLLADPTRGRAAADQPARRDEPAEEAIDYPFDTQDPVGRFMSDFHRSTTTSNREIARRLESLESALNDRVGRIETSAQQSRAQSVVHSYISAGEAAAAKIAEPFRPAFMDLIRAAARERLAGNHNLTPDQIVAHYSKPFVTSSAQHQRVKDAARQRTAQGNAQLPKRPGGTGSPASPQAKRVPRLEDFNKRLMRMAQ